MRFAIVAICALSWAPAAFGQKEPADSGGCSGTAPTALEREMRGDWHKQLWDESIAKAYADKTQVEDRKAQIDPRKIGFGEAAELRSYSDTELTCWAETGDQLAAYALGLRLRDTSSDSYKWLKLAAEGRNSVSEFGKSEEPTDLCAENVKGGDMSCAYGLPEAQFLLGGLICANKYPGTSSDGREWLARAFKGGLWPAKSFSQQQCKS